MDTYYKVIMNKLMITSIEMNTEILNNQRSI